MVVELVQLELRDGVLVEEAAWQALVLILKGGGDYRGIGLVEGILKAVAAIFNRHFTASITYHNSLHGFQAGLRYRDRHPRDQSDPEGYGHEVGGTPCHIPEPT